MPAIIALLLRQVIMSVATGAVVTGAQELLDGTARELVNEIKDKENVTEQTAKDIVGNIFIDLAVNSVSIFTVLKTGAGVKAAEFLGLTSKGLVKKTLTGAAATTATKLTANGGKAIATSLFTKIGKIAAIPAAGIWLTSALANIIEPGIYKPEQTNALYKKLGIPFQYPTGSSQRKAGLLENSDFTKLAEALEAAGISYIQNPVAQQSQPYSRDGLADIIDYVTGKAVLDGKKATASAIRPLIQPYLSGGNVKVVSAVPPANGGGSSTGGVQNKVFTGIVSQGVVGAGLVFTPRPDDLIESVSELRDAASNNLAPFLNSLLGKIVYEVKVVASVITKDGFKQTGAAQQIRTGTYSNGNPKYKTVVNKFATLTVYALTDKGSRAKLTTIILGPVDSARLTVGQNDLRTLETELPAIVTTTDVNEITGIVNKKGEVNVKEKDKVEPAPVKTENTVIVSEGGYNFAVGHAPDNSRVTVDDVPFIKRNGELFRESDGAKAVVGTQKPVNNPTAGQTASVPAPTPPVSASSVSGNKPGANATTLFEWYQAQGQSLPSVSARANIYEGLGLGPKSYYTGTAEQNTKLLNALKIK